MRTADLESLKRIANRLAEFVAPRDKHYDGSWKLRGGPGAFFTVVRPIDRFETIAARSHSDLGTKVINDKVQMFGGQLHPPYDIFAIWEAEDFRGDLYKDGTLSACVQDIACYMLLIIEEMEARKAAVYGTVQQTYDSRNLTQQATPTGETQLAAEELVQQAEQRASMHNESEKACNNLQDDRHAAELKAIRDEYESRIRTIRNEYEDRIQAIRNEYGDRIDHLRGLHNNQAETIIGYQAKVDALRKELSSLQRLLPD